MNLRNVLILAAVVVAALIILGFVSTILNSIIPLTIVAVVAFLLGRMSTRTNLLQAGADLAKRAAQQFEQSTQAAKSAEAAPAADDKTAAKTAKLPQTSKLAQTDKLEDARVNVSDKDFDVKTSDQVLADAKRLEEDVTKRAAGYDPTAALEERKRRLLGDQKEDTPG